MPTLIAPTTHARTVGGGQCRIRIGLACIHQHLENKRGSYRRTDVTEGTRGERGRGAPKSTDFIWCLSISLSLYLSSVCRPSVLLSASSSTTLSTSSSLCLLFSPSILPSIRPFLSLSHRSLPSVLFPIFVPGSFSETNDIFWSGSLGQRQRERDGGSVRRRRTLIHVRPRPSVLYHTRLPENIPSVSSSLSR